MSQKIKNFSRNILTRALAKLAHGIIRKYQPIVVMVTGSVGKTSTKDAIAAALSERFFLRKSEKSFNSDIGVPLTIIGAENPWSHPLAWMRVFQRGFAALLLPTHYPKLLVLEVGADRPGDLLKILKIAQPSVVVVTLLPSVPVHVEAYETPAAVREEEFVPALALDPAAPLIICADDEYAIKHSRRVDAHVSSFGLAETADVRITDVGVWMDATHALPSGDTWQLRQLKGMRATLTIHAEDGTVETHELKVPGALGRSQLFAPSAAIATALALGMPVKDAFKGLESYIPPAGRGRIFKGKKNTVLIDDSYNSSPAAAEEILKSLSLLSENSLNNSSTLTNVRNSRKIAILGDMLELGRYSVAEHTRIGHIAKDCVDVLVTVGSRARAIGEASITDGMPQEHVHHFNTSLEAAMPIEELLREGDIVLIKGSQGMRMERIVRPLLADFADVEKLVRQDEEWSRR
jgi:UDP-N-acetylmuramoyl-tripeptide--D-alanyl-D-alanine ligase